MQADFQHETQTLGSTSGDKIISGLWRAAPGAVRKAIDLPVAKSRKHCAAMEAIVLDAIQSAKRSPGRRISYPRWRDRWIPRYTGVLTYDSALPAIDALVDAEILVEHEARKPGEFGIQSSFLPAPWLAELRVEMAKEDVGEILRLKNAEGHLVDYNDSKRTDAMRKSSQRINRILEETELNLDAPGYIRQGDVMIRGEQILYTDCRSLYRVFKGSWKSGGRWYGGWWQTVRSVDRQHFLIDGQRTAEIDYRTLHTQILYALAGETLDMEDAYAIPGYTDPEFRPFVKRALNTLINTKDLREATAAVRRQLESQGMWDVSASALIRAIKAAHPKIEHLFHAGLGMRLQYADSEMTRQILTEMMLKRGVKCLPVHDSYIVPRTAKDELDLVMKRAFDDVMASGRI